MSSQIKVGLHYFTYASARKHYCEDQFNSYTPHICSSWPVFLFLEPARNSFFVNIWLFCFCRFVGVGATVLTLKRSSLCSSTRRAVTDGRGHSWRRTCVGCVGGTTTARTVAGSSTEVWFQNRRKKSPFSLILVSLILSIVYWPWIVCPFLVSQNLQNWSKCVLNSFFVFMIFSVIFKVSSSKEYRIHFLHIVLAWTLWELKSVATIILLPVMTQF